MVGYSLTTSLSTAVTLPLGLRIVLLWFACLSATQAIVQLVDISKRANCAALKAHQNGNRSVLTMGIKEVHTTSLLLPGWLSNRVVTQCKQLKNFGVNERE